MIKYEGIENTYMFDKQILENIIRMIDPNQYYKGNGYGCTQENVSILVNEVNLFIDTITPVEKNVILEREETEEEAREYFGTDFVKNFDRLMTVLDKQQTVIALHGTNISNCHLICENGLKYKNPSLYGTTVRLNMAYGKEDMHYDDYAGLLNWKHGKYDKNKGIVILAIPYECYYKEGLWNHYKETKTDSVGEQDYKINPDFVVGYLDIENKKFIYNPKYNRQHNYQGYEKDSDIFKENKSMTNELYAQIASNIKELEANKNLTEDNNEKQIKVEPDDIFRLIELMRSAFSSVVNGSPNGMNEEAYEKFLEELVNSFKLVVQILPLLKTNEQVRLEKEEEEKRWSQFRENSNSTINDPAWAMWDNMDCGHELEDEIAKKL